VYWRVLVSFGSSFFFPACVVVAAYAAEGLCELTFFVLCYLLDSTGVKKVDLCKRQTDVQLL
jgi:hypothetical protein